MQSAPSVPRVKIHDILLVLAAATLVIVAVAYAEIVYTYDMTTLLVSVISPVILGTVFIAFTKNRVLLYAYLAFIWAVLDDRPIYFDSVLTWPEVTRFNPLLPRLFMNVIIHALTVIFLYLSLRGANKGSKSGLWHSPRVLLPAVIFLVLAYAQNIPLSIVQNAVQEGTNPGSWYPFDVSTKLLALLFLYVALKEGRRGVSNEQRPNSLRFRKEAERTTLGTTLGSEFLRVRNTSFLNSQDSRSISKIRYYCQSCS